MIKILPIIVLCVLILCSCRKDDNNHPSDKDKTIGDTTVENEKSEYVVEDEVILDYGQDEQQDVPTSEDSKDSQEAVEGESNHTEEQSIEDSTDSTENTGGKESTDNNETELRNPYDKDGDGFVDGWY